MKILVVDDDEPTLELIGYVLKSAGADVSLLRNSTDAVSRITEEPFSGIFLDLEMPGLDGFELARRIRRSMKNRSTPIVIVTGCTDRTTMQQAFAAGGSFYLEKPLDRQKLVRLFNSIRGMLVHERNAIRQN